MMFSPFNNVSPKTSCITSVAAITAFVTSYVMWSNNEVIENRNPVLIIPGLTTSQLEMKIDQRDQSELVNEWCQSYTEDFELVWLRAKNILPGYHECFNHDFKLNYDSISRRTFNQPNVQIRTRDFGSTSSIERSDPRFPFPMYFTPIIWKLRSLGYERDIDIRVAPFDWRKSPVENDEYKLQTKNLIEDMYQSTGQKIVLMGHSLGPVYVLPFLYSMTQEWKDKHIKSLISIGAPFGGTFYGLIIHMTESLIGDYFPSSLNYIKGFGSTIKSFSILPSLMPSRISFNESQPLIKFKSGEDPIAIKDYGRFYSLLNNTNGYEIMKDNLEFMDQLKHPGVDVHCITSRYIPTISGLTFRSQSEFPSLPVGIEFSDGDGLVNWNSLEACDQLKDPTSGFKFSHTTFRLREHVSMIWHPDIISHLIKTIVN